MKKLYTQSQVAAKAGVTPPTVSNMVKRGKIRQPQHRAVSPKYSPLLFTYHEYLKAVRILKQSKSAWLKKKTAPKTRVVNFGRRGSVTLIYNAKKAG